MRGLFIKDLEMPAVCDNCLFLDEYGDYPCCRITGETRGYNFKCSENKMDRCPLEEIDVELAHWICLNKEITEKENSLVEHFQCSRCGTIFDAIKTAPPKLCPSCGSVMNDIVFP